jgi:hypothetical protein
MDEPIRIFQDSHASDEALLMAARMIAPETPPSTWRDVANDPAYRPFQRGVAVYGLLKWHLPRPVVLEQAATLLKGAPWLKNARVEKIVVMGGEIPVVVPEGGSAFVIHLEKEPGKDQPDIGFYLALNNDLSADDLCRMVMGEAGKRFLGEVMITDWYLFPEDLIPG